MNPSEQEKYLVFKLYTEFYRVCSLFLSLLQLCNFLHTFLPLLITVVLALQPVNVRFLALPLLEVGIPAVVVSVGGGSAAATSAG